MTAKEVVYRGSRRNLLIRICIPLLPFGYWAWTGIPKEGIDAVGGWLCAGLFAAGAAFCAIYLVNPPRLRLTSEGFTQTALLGGKGVRISWCDVGDVGLYTRQVVSLRGDRPAETRGVGYMLKLSALSGMRGRRAATSLGTTGWHGVVADSWGVPAVALLEEFRHRLAAAKAD